MKLTLNLASRRYVNEQAVKLGCLAVCACLVILLSLQFYSYLQIREENLAIQMNIASLEKELSGTLPKQLTKQEIAAQRLEFEQAKAMLREDAFRWTELFDRLERLLPGDVSIRSFSPNYEKDSLVIAGVSKDLKGLQELLDRLHADTFSQVFLTSQSQIEVLDYLGEKQPALSFSIQLAGVF